MENKNLSFGELLRRAMECPSAADIIALAGEYDIDLNAGQAEEYFRQLHATGELSDEELENASGGGCHKKDGRLVVTVGNNCNSFQCKYCDVAYTDHYCLGKSPGAAAWVKKKCSNCRYCSYENALWLCNHINNFVS